KANETVAGETLADAGWYDDLQAGDTTKIRGNASGVKRLLTGHGITGYSLNAKGSGAYELNVDSALVDLVDSANRLSRPQELSGAGEPIGALKQLEHLVPLLRPAIKMLGKIKPHADSVWADELREASALRENVIAAYFGGIVKDTNYDPSDLLDALCQV